MTSSTARKDSIRHIRDALRLLHRTLLDAERLEYERSFGRIGSDFYLLQLAAEDPQFAWLRALTAVMLDIDARVARPEPVSDWEMRLLSTRIRALLLDGDRPTPFQQRYQAALQQHPSVVMAHSGVMTLLPLASPVRLFKGTAATDVEHCGDLRVHMYRPGDLIPGFGDRGYGPLALVAASFLAPGTVVPMHEHRNEEIISWLPDGVMRHDDLAGGTQVLDAGHLLVMNAGRGFSHSERTLESDPPLHMLQVFVRPRAINLEPGIQFGPLPAAEPNIWRHIVGPEGEGAPFAVRNAIEMHDIRLDAGARTQLPRRDGWTKYVVVHEGEVELDGVPMETSERAVVFTHRPVRIMASTSSILVAFLIDPDATVSRAGTVGR